MEIELVAGETGGDECGDQRGSAGQTLNLNPCRQALTNEQKPRIGNARSARIGNQCRSLPVFYPAYILFYLFMLIINMISVTFFINFKMFQQVFGRSCIFTKNKIHLLQNTQRTKCDIFEVADGGRNDVEFKVQSLKFKVQSNQELKELRSYKEL